MFSFTVPALLVWSMNPNLNLNDLESVMLLAVMLCYYHIITTIF